MSESLREPFRPRIVPVGDGAILIELGETIDPAINALVLALDARIRAMALEGVVELVPTYRSLLVHYDPERVDGRALLARLSSLDLDHPGSPPEGRLWTVPVAYGGPFGIDLEAVAARHGLSAEDVVRLHTAPTYRVYMVGFVPGFTYLGGLDPRLHTPRLDDPRPRTPAGSVSIGGIQAGIASLEIPSGWHLLGRTPVRTFDPERTPPLLLEPGDRVRFVPIDPATFAELDRRAAAHDPLIAPEPA
ncbi:MAG: 5-oxoprolinase subunit PxpB [Geminicoccaceae bacterium]|nr:5-oxoprolinase subunit PxpB [Geminicoccaceae bacterium]MDW8370272.1 5-oxoprolinase subunit PxpB [Geminicoccaceae bacterium]